MKLFTQRPQFLFVLILVLAGVLTWWLLPTHRRTSSLQASLTETKSFATVKLQAPTHALGQPPTQLDMVQRAQLNQAYGQLPLSFEANQGQTDPRVKFLARSSGQTLFLTADEAVLQLRNEETRRGAAMEATHPQSSALRLKLLQANPNPSMSGLKEAAGKSNYFIGHDPLKWRTNVTNFAEVKYEAVYPGIDLVWHGQQRQLEYDFIVAPGAPTSRIKMAVIGAQSMKIDDNGALVLRADGREMRMLKPLAWQEVNGERKEVACHYQISARKQITFRLGAYDHHQPLVIDPVLAYSSYLGGTGVDNGLGIAVDSQGQAYITGSTASTDFPGSSTIQSAKGAQNDAFVLKLNASGTDFIYATWLGGDFNESGQSIAVDNAGNAWVTGSTSSTNFPTKDPLQANRNGGIDAFITKLNPNGSALIYSTYFGGAGIESSVGIAIDSSGNAYFTGSTDSLDLPLVGAFQTSKQGSAAYRSSNAGGNWSASGSGLEAAQVNDIAIDPTNPSMLYATTTTRFFKSTNQGTSWSQTSPQSFSATQLVIDPQTPTTLYAISQSSVFKSTDSGATWVRKNVSQVETVAIDPLTPATLYAGGVNGARKSTDGGETWLPLSIPPLGGGGGVQVRTLVVDPVTPATVYAGTNRGAYKTTNGGQNWLPIVGGFTGFFPGAQFVVSKVAISRSQPSTLFCFADGVYVTTNGGDRWRKLNFPTLLVDLQALAIDPTNPNIVYIGTRGNGIYQTTDSGVTWNPINTGLNSRDVRSIIIASNAPATVYAGTTNLGDAFVAKLNAAGSALVYSSYLGGSDLDAVNGIALDPAGNVYLTGRTQSPNFPTANPYQGSLNGIGDAFVTKINAAGSALVWSTFLGGSSSFNSDSGQGIAVNAAGQAFVAGTTAGPDFPLAQAMQGTFKGVLDAFVTRFSADGAQLDYSTYLGGELTDQAAKIALDSASNAYIIGSSNSSDFPLLNSVQGTKGNFEDAVVTKLSPGGSIVYSTFLGGDSTDNGFNIAVDTAGNAYLTGNTSSTDFPSVNSTRPARPLDAFVAKLAVSTDLAITLSDLPDPAMTGSNLTYTLTITNNGPDPAAGVSITDTLPVGVTFVSATPSQGSCSGTSTVTCNLGNLVSGSQASVSISTTIIATSNFSNTASVTSSTMDFNPANNSATQQTRITTQPSIYGRVALSNGAGVGQVGVTLSGVSSANTTTASDGGFQFAELTAGGNYTVTPARQGYVFTPSSRNVNNLIVDQAANFTATACVFALTPGSQSFSSSGGTGSVTITSPDPRCAWTVRNDAPWITLTSATSGTGNGTLTFKVAPTFGSRSATLIIAGQPFPVWQEFNGCTQAEFSAPLLITASDAGIAGFVIKDFNSDGKPDAAFFEQSPQNNVYVVLSQGGGYDAPKVILDGASLQAIRAGDFNRDGKPDLALTRPSANNVIVMLGNGAGSFASPVNYATAPNPRGLVVADFNSDGKQDLAALTDAPSGAPPSMPKNISLLLGDGNGSFSGLTNIGVPLTNVDSQRIETGDFNGDGKTDVITNDIGGTMQIMLGNGSGGFTTGSNFKPVNFPAALVIGDFNGDGRDDLALPGSNRQIQVLLASPSGALDMPRTATVSDEVSSFTALDINHDGKADLAVRTNYGLEVLHSTGNGDFVSIANYLIGLVGSSSGIQAPGDFNQDGNLDLFTTVLGPFINNTILPPPAFAILMSNGNGFAAPRRSPYLTPDSLTYTPVITLPGDLNHDGVTDLIIVYGNTDKAAMLLGDGRGGFSPPAIFTVGLSLTGLRLADFNRDGHLDLAALSSDTSSVTIMLGNGKGNFSALSPIAVGFNPRSLAIGDFNGDGKLDLVVKSKTSGLALLTGDGQGGFTEAASGLAPSFSDEIMNVGDFNGDGKLDLVVASKDKSDCAPVTERLSVLAGNGQGGFAAEVMTTLISRPRTLEAADLNGDGLTDLVATFGCGTAPGIYVFLSNGQGGFAAPVRYTLNIEISLLSLADLNGDGKLDAAVNNSSPGVTSFLLGNGDGSFKTETRLPITPSFSLLAIGDFDQDGAKDLAVVAGSAGIAVLSNTARCFAASSVVTTSAASYHGQQLSGDSLALAFGVNLAAEPQVALTLPLPTVLAGTSVRITDSAGVDHLAPLLFVSPGQINYLIPSGVATGPAMITVLRNNNPVATGVIQITTVNPDLFTADTSGQGPAAAIAVHATPSGAQTFELVARFDLGQNKYVTIPIDLGPAGDIVVLELFGTGLRQRSTLSNVTATIGGVPVQVFYAGAQGNFAGLDQVNVEVPRSLIGRGEVDVVLTVDGKVANTIKINIK